MKWIKEYVYAFLASKRDLRNKIINVSVIKSAIVSFIALIIISLPTKFSYLNYLINLLINGISIISINSIVGFIASQVAKKSFVQISVGLIYITSIAFIVNSIILFLLHLVGLPFGVSSVLWAASATLIPTYYFIVLLAIASGSVVEGRKNDMKRYVIEGIALILWFIYVFYVLSLTV
ncbi:MAG: hypothetical protein ACPL0A_01590 [Candidatus Micrarchaeia archaeon]